MTRTSSSYASITSRCAVGLALLLTCAWTLAAEPADKKVYIVQLREPAALEAAGPQPDPRAAAVSDYGAALVASHDRLLAEIGAGEAKLYSYRLSFNGFAARLTPAQAAQLRTHPLVQRLWEDRVKTLKTNASPTALGLLEGGSGLRSGLGLSGENVVIGIIDSGITPEHPSFADRVEKKKPRLCRSEWAKNALLGRWLCARFRKPRYTSAFQPLAGWNGRCEAGERFSASDCNHKLIGARFYADGFGQAYDMDPNEFLSPRDADGHGTHIASIAAGVSVKAAIGGTELATLSGMAPRARIAVYKACWLEPGGERASCAMSDLQRAIEDAIADGVQVINYAIGTTEGGPADPDALALLAAANAGIFAAVAAGNSGPDSWTVESPGTSPWVTTVASASRAGQRFDEVLRVSAPATATGDFSFREAGFTPTLRSTGALEKLLVLANDGDAEPADACTPLVNADDVAGQIALVQRGSCTFQEKIINAEAAGAAAVVVYSNAGTAILMTGERDSVGIPAVMIDQGSGEFLASRLAAGDAVIARLQKGLTATRSETGSRMQSASSRGPNPNITDILKPDIAAPGVDILGAQTMDVANGVRGEQYQYLSGTSMAVPHVAGIAALLRQAHPDWSPAAIRSALMTTARQDVIREDGQANADPFDFGAGYIVPNRAVAPGLVYDAGRDDYDAFACGAGFAYVSDERCQALVDAGRALDADALNLPAITTSALVTERVIRRRVTNVGAAARYEAQVVAPPGIEVRVAPVALTLAAGETAEFDVTLVNLGDPDGLDQWNIGTLSWVSGDTRVVSPLVIAPGRIAAPDIVSGDGAAGSTAFEVAFGYSGAYGAAVLGLVAPVTYDGVVTDDPLNFYTVLPDDLALPDHIRRFRITVLPGTRYLRLTAGTTVDGSSDDIDLYAQCPDGQCPDGGSVLAAATESGFELLDIVDPPPGEYVIDVHGYEIGGGLGGPGAGFEVGVWAIGSGAAAGAFSVVSAPADATPGATGEVTLRWQDLADNELYLGLVTHSDAAGEIALTLVEIATAAPP